MLSSLIQAWQVRQTNFPPEIGFDYPSRTLPVSLTGTACTLDCAHCGRHYLRHMVPIEQVSGNQGIRESGGPQSAISNLQSAIRSLLISGGCDAQGRVPVASHLDAIRALRPGRRLNWHVGLIEQADLEAIRPYVDTVSFDLVGDDKTIREVYGIDRTVDDYAACYQRLRAAVPVVPHLTIGLRGGQMGHERPALQLLQTLGASALVFLVFIPTPGTRYANRQPPAVAEVVDILVEARLMFPAIPLTLGCMRPGGAYRRQLDALAVRAGINRMVNPAPTATRLAEELRLGIVKSDECCVF